MLNCDTGYAFSSTGAAGSKGLLISPAIRVRPFKSKSGPRFIKLASARFPKVATPLLLP